MAKHVFLSDEWLAAVAQVVEEHRGRDLPDLPQQDLMANLVVTETPFDTDLQLHLGARGGTPEWGQGHRDDADVSLTLDYATATELFVEGENPQAAMQAAMQAFMGGRVKVTGDMTKLIALQQEAWGAQADPELYRAVSEITA